MKVQKRDGSIGRSVLIDMITDKAVLGELAAKWNQKEGMFKDAFSNRAGKWCVDYYKEFGDAPGQHIEHIFSDWRTKTKDEASIQMMENLLASLSREHEHKSKNRNSAYLIKRAKKHFQSVRMLKLRDGIDEAETSGNFDDIEKKIKSYSDIGIGVSSGVHMLRDKEAIRQAFEAKHEALIQYPGDLGVFFGDCLERDGFVSLMGPVARGKSFLLLDIAWMGVEQGRKVAFFSIGDMTQKQVIMRFGARAAQKPVRPGTIRIPKIMSVDGKEVRVKHKEIEIERGLSWKGAYKAFSRIDNLLVLSCHSNLSLSVYGLTSVLQGWEREGYVPDVIVIDYADNLAPSGTGDPDTYIQVGITWKLLRALSQSLNCLVVTATQTKADALKASTLEMSHFSQNYIAKMAEVTAMIGINQEKEEKRLDAIRLNPIKIREDEFDVDKCVYVAGCRSIASPMMLSTY